MSSATQVETRDSFDSFLEQDLKKELLRFTTAGSVDDGKSTLIGRLLHDSKSVYEDQLASVKKSRFNRSGGPIDFSLLTDGLRAEREQGITIDVAYRYFATSRRKFIIADTPGHEQYTRNMATGASTADLAVVLIDGSKGLLPQTRRHAFISSLLGIPNVVAAVNKMDLLGYREDAFLDLQEEFHALAKQLKIANVRCIPISALEGDNVVVRSRRTPWYSGLTLLEHLETVPVQPVATSGNLRFPVQYVIRPDASFRGFAGRIASGVVRPGDPVLALPSGQRTRVKSIVAFDGDLPEVFHPMSVTLRLEDEIDLSRGDMLVSPDDIPHVSRRFEAMVVWLHSKPLELRHNYLVKHTSSQVRAKAINIRHRIDINTLAHLPASQLEINDIAAVEFETAKELFFDPYAHNRTTGSFILIDPISNATVAAGMIREDLSATTQGARQYDSGVCNLRYEPVSAAERRKRHGHNSGIILAKGRPVLAGLLERTLFEQGFEVLAVSDAISDEEFASLARFAEAAGTVMICSIRTIGPIAANALSVLPPGCVFDLSQMSLADDDDEALQQVLPLAQSLRTSANQGDRGKAN
jgi:bifunctional enzyme CysN/CysC/sulfate adenylyltransferase subunit 1